MTLVVGGSQLEGCSETCLETLDVGYDDGADALTEGLEAVVELGDHACSDDACGLVLFEGVIVEGGDERGVVVGVEEDARFLEAEDEFDVGEVAHGTCELGGDGVGVGVEEVALSVVGYGGEDWHDALLDEGVEDIGLDAAYIAYEAEVDDLSVGHFLGCSAVGAYDAHVGTREAEGVDASGLELCDDVFVDEAGVDHGDDPEGVGIGDASSFDHEGLDAELLGEFGCAASAAVDEGFRSGERGEVVEQGCEGVLLLDDFATDFYYGEVHEWNFLVCVGANIGKRGDGGWRREVKSGYLRRSE